MDPGVNLVYLVSQLCLFYADVSNYPNAWVVNLQGRRVSADWGHPSETTAPPRLHSSAWLHLDKVQS